MRLNKKDYIAKYGEEAWVEESEKRKKYYKKYCKDNEKRKQWLKEYRKKNKEKIAASSKKYRDTHDLKEYRRNTYLQLKERGYFEERYNQKEVRATSQISSYNKNDKEKNRGECTLSKEWIIENIYSSSCIYCGETDWHKLGCDRVDNNKAHTPENVVCACWSCNNDRQKRRMSVDEYKIFKTLS